MLFVEGNHFCPACEKSGNCKLQAVAYRLRVLDLEYEQLWPHRELDASHPDVLLDRDRCILCGLCVRASHQADGKDVFALGGRGVETKLLVNSPTGRLVDSNLAVTDAAVSVCPVGALLAKRRGFVVPIGQRLYDAHPISGDGERPGESEAADVKAARPEAASGPTSGVTGPRARGDGARA